MFVDEEENLSHLIPISQIISSFLDCLPNDFCRVGTASFADETTSARHPAEIFLAGRARRQLWPIISR